MTRAKRIDGRFGTAYYTGDRPSLNFDMPAAIERLHRILNEVYGDDDDKDVIYPQYHFISPGKFTIDDD
jgi:hypothetical protein